jgi:23S rRNA pseudouridine1911/1915/1917 synthase
MKFIAEKLERLDKFLVRHFTEYSRMRFQRLIKEGAVKVNGRIVVKPAFVLKKGDRIVLLEEKIILPEKEFVIEPEPGIPLNIVYEDNDIVVINKQPGLLTHPTLSQRRHTLVNVLVARYPEIINVGESPLRPGIVHRLDKDTSGLLIVAKNQKAFLFIKEQFLKRTIIKKYLALVEGVPKEKRGIISYSIRPSKRNRLKKVAIKTRIDADKHAHADLRRKVVRAAETYYQVKKVYEIPSHKIALLEVSPKTGRTHQIRTHLAAIGHPIVGDILYGASKKGIAKRQMLHAYFLDFTAPSGKRLALEAGFPEDIEEVIRKTAK